MTKLRGLLLILALSFSCAADIVQPVRILEFPDELPGQSVAVVFYKLPTNQVFTIRQFQQGVLQPEKTETRSTADQTVPLWIGYTSRVVDGVPQMQIVITDSAPSAVNAKFFIPTVK